jgi:DNA replication protein DnaC
LTAIHEQLDAELETFSSHPQAVSELLLRLFEAEYRRVKEQRIKRYIRQSKLPDLKSLDEFDFHFQPNLDQRLVLELATLGFVSRRQGVILAGNSGTGKSHIAKALALLGCKAEMYVRYTTAATMLTTLFSALADFSLDQKLKHYLSPALLVIDELGFERLEQEDARNAALFFKVIEGRYAKKSTIITTNIDFEQLGAYLGDPVITTAIVDRMIHHSTVITIEGPSWRLKESEELNAKARQASRENNKAQPASPPALHATPKKRSAAKRTAAQPRT